MAGPFSVNPNSAPEVTPINLRGGTSVIVPAVDYAGAVAQAAQVGAQVFIETQKEKAQEEVKEKLRSVADALDVAANPRLQEMFFSEEALQNPYFRDVKSEFDKLNLAVEKGRIPQEYAMERVESKLRDAQKRLPAFANELRAAAQDALGFDPSGRSVARLFQSAQGQQRLTPEERAAEELRYQAALVGVDPETYLGVAQQGYIQDQQLSSMEFQQKREGFDTQRFLEMQRTGAANVELNLMSELMKTYTANNGEIDTQGLQTAVRAQYGALRERLVAGAKGLSGAQLNSELAFLDDSMKRTLELYEDHNYLNMLTKNNKTISAMYENGLLQHPILGPMYTIVGPEGMSAVLGDAQQWLSNPSATAAFFQSGESGKFSLALMISGNEQALRVLQGEPMPTDPVQAQKVQQTIAYLMGKKLATAKNDTDAADAVNMLTEKAGTDYTVAMMRNPQVARTAGSKKGAHPGVIRSFESELAKFRREYAGLMQTGKYKQEDFRIENGKVVVPFDVYATPGERDNTLTVWARRLNNTIEAAENAKRVGILPGSIYETPEGLLKLWNSEPLPAAQEQQEVWDFDPATGEFTRGGGQ